MNKGPKRFKRSTRTLSRSSGSLPRLSADLVRAALLFLAAVPAVFPARLLGQQGLIRVATESSLPEAPTPSADLLVQPGDLAQANPQMTGSISGVVVDEMGAAISGATVKLIRDVSSTNKETKTGGDGQFTFTGVGAGPFKILLSAAGFGSKVVSGSISAGQIYTAPQATLNAATSAEVDVDVSRTEIAEIQIETEEKQRVLGVFPNFYVSYVADAVPLSPTQKFKLASRFMIDPVSFGLTAITAGAQQASNTYPGYGQGASGFAKRYAAASGTFFDGVLIGNAVLPVIFKQDPRYFYKGTGSVRSRILYAMANSVICKGDNGHWQANYSGIIGGIAASGIADLYYPHEDRDGASTIFANTAIGVAESAAGNVIQEFLIPKLSLHRTKTKAQQP